MLPTSTPPKHRIPTSVLGIAFTLVWGFGVYCFASFDAPVFKATGILVAFAGAFGSTWFQINGYNVRRANGTIDKKPDDSQVVTKTENAIIMSCIWLSSTVFFKLFLDARAFQNVFIIFTTLYLGTIAAGLRSRETNS